MLFLLTPLGSQAAPRATLWGPAAGSPPQLLPCAPSPDAPGAAAQRLDLRNASAAGLFQVHGSFVPGASDGCLETNPQWVPGVNITVVFNACEPPPAAPAGPQSFRWAGAGGDMLAVRPPPPGTYDMCLAVLGGAPAPGAQVWLENCTDGLASQRWSFDAVAGALRPAATPGLCLDMGTAWRPCASAPFSALPFCDATLPLEARLDDMLSRMTLAEKIQQLQSNSAGAPSIGLSPWAVGDFTHSAGEPLPNTYPFAAGGETVYPAASCMAQSFNASLWAEVGDAVGDEVRSLYNAGFLSLIGWSPNINIARDVCITDTDAQPSPRPLIHHPPNNPRPNSALNTTRAPLILSPHSRGGAALTR